MRPSLPICCAPAAFEMLSRQVAAIESADALIGGAIAVSMHKIEDVDPAEAEATVQGWADTIRRRVHGPQQQALLAHLHGFLFDELGLMGNTADYHNPANSYLPTVLKARRGLPITLCLVYKLVGERLGLQVHGVGLPGHFLAAVQTVAGPMLIDCFAGGRALSIEQAQDLMHRIVGPEAEWSDEMLRPVTNRHWLTRMLQNLLHTYGGRGRYADVAAMIEMEMLLWPGQAHLQRDLALVLARAGMAQPASAWLDLYLRDNPDDPRKSDLMQLLEVLTT